MINKILIPLDGSELSDRVLVSVRRLLLDLEGADVELFHVIQPLTRPEEEWGESQGAAQSALALCKETAQLHLDRVQARLAKDGIKCSVRVDTGDPAATILARIEEFQASLVTMATHGRTGVERWVRGSVAERILRRCPVPLLLCNPVAAQGEAQGGLIRKILVPLDGSERSARILPLVKSFAHHYGSQVHLMRVATAQSTGEGSTPTLPITSAEALASLEPYAEAFRSADVGVRCSSPAARSPAEVVLETVENDATDLVAMTTHGYSGIDRWIFGSVAEKIMRHCPCPLLVQRENA